MVGRARQASIALETRRHERLIGQVVTCEQRRDAVVERRLRERTGGRQQAEHRPFDAVGEGWRSGFLIVRVCQPPAPGLDLGQAALVRAAEFIADQREEALDRIGRSVRDGDRPAGDDRWPRVALR